MNLNKESGQTNVEYILLIAVIVAIMSGVFQKLEEYIVTNPDSMQSQFIKGFQNTFSGSNGSFQGQYKYFRIRR